MLWPDDGLPNLGHAQANPMAYAHRIFAQLLFREFTPMPAARRRDRICETVRQRLMRIRIREGHPGYLASGEARRFPKRPERDQNAKSPRTEIRGLLCDILVGRAGFEPATNGLKVLVAAKAARSLSYHYSQRREVCPCSA
jgi:hypothetical protein